MAGKKLTALEMPEEDEIEVLPTLAPVSSTAAPIQHPILEARADATTADYQPPSSITLPPIPAAPVRRIMVQLSIKAPVDLVDRLEVMANATRAQKQAIIAAALDAYMRGHGY